MIDKLLAMVQGVQAARSLKQLEGQNPSGYAVAGENKDVYNRAVKYADQGYTAPERSLFQRNTSRAINNRFRAGTAAGGGQASQALLSLGLDAELGAQAEFAANDAELKRNALGFLKTAAAPFQAVLDANKQRELSQFDNAVASATNLANTSTQNGVDAIKNDETMLVTLASSGALGGAGGAGGGLTGGGSGGVTTGGDKSVGALPNVVPPTNNVPAYGVPAYENYNDEYDIYGRRDKRRMSRPFMRNTAQPPVFAPVAPAPEFQYYPDPSNFQDNYR